MNSHSRVFEWKIPALNNNPAPHSGC
jgi:hypothetical protein